MELELYADPQEVLINSLEGIYLVDAGAGTGKTYSIVRRYGKILENGKLPEDILLVTFTNKAAEQMRDEVIKKLSTDKTIVKLLEAPIVTFQAFCSRVIKKGGMNSPVYLGLNEYLGKNFSIVEDIALENELFRKFFLNFCKTKRVEYQYLIYFLEYNYETVLKLIKKLCSCGIFPSTTGWSVEDSRRLKGSFEEFSRIFDELNDVVFHKTRPGVEVNNKLYKKFTNRNKDKIYLNYSDVNVISGKRLNIEVKEEYNKDTFQEEQIKFIGEVYISYIEHLLKRNLLNFQFETMFAYLTLYNDTQLRRSMQFDYVMVDEFQDTDEIQFKLIMMLCKGSKDIANLCVVGDWKQGIYSFRNASIKNITEFGNCLKQYKKELNRGEVRVDYNADDFIKITFIINYRSSESILNFSRHSLFLKGSKDDEPDFEIVEENFKEALTPKWELEDLTEIVFYKAEDRLNEYKLILQKISELVGEKSKYRIKTFNKEEQKYEKRKLKYSDICVLSRNKKFLLELKREGFIQGIPIKYGGGLEIFASEAGILTLAWLRLMLNSKDMRGWVPVLDKEGYSFPEVNYFKKNILSKNADYKLFSELPDELSGFLKHIQKFRNNVLFAVEAVLRRYGLQNGIGNKIIEYIKNWMKSDLISLNELAELIDKSANTEIDVELANASDAVLTQSIHIAKGMEYPVVIVANMNDRNFPSGAVNSDTIFYNDASGMRMKKFYTSNENYHYLFHNWRTDLVGAVTGGADYDEERRLLYVALTRAKQYLFLTCSKPSPFFTELAAKTNSVIIDDFEYPILKPDSDITEEKTRITIDTKIQESKKFISPHGLMEEVKLKFKKIEDSSNEFAIAAVEDGVNFGLKIHNAAHKIASGIEVETSSDEIEKVKTFIAALNANELRSEVDFLYPKDDKMIRGTIDLLAFYDDRIVVIDYKTDSNKNYLERYKVQIDVYKEVIKSIYKDKNVTGKIYFVRLDEVIDL